MDTSALLAIQLEEPEADAFLEVLRVRRARIGSPTLFEYALVMTQRLGDEGGALAVNTVEALKLEVIAFSPDHARMAAEAHRRYGKGRHPARLNFGDCMVYALAKALGSPLLYKGDDFARTDIVSALA